MFNFTAYLSHKIVPCNPLGKGKQDLYFLDKFHREDTLSDFPGKTFRWLFMVNMRLIDYCFI